MFIKKSLAVSTFNNATWYNLLIVLKNIQNARESKIQAKCLQDLGAALETVCQ